jgi:cytoskeletal protein CcmA (bactofilin family)
MNVEGEVEGVIQIDGCLTVAPGGRVRSESLSCRDARIAGSVEGPLTVYQTLLIASGGAVAGDIAVGELLIEQGGSFDGTCRKLKAEELPSSRVAEPVEASKRHDPAPKPGQKPDTAESGKQTREISSPT